jgi:ubiquinone biosynthesis accessory factor UbiJ
MAAVEWLVSRLLERSCARARAESSRASELLANLAGKRLAVRVLGTPWAEQPICIDSDGVTLSCVSGGAAADATLVGAPVSLLALAGSDPEAPIRRGDVRIEGDAPLAQQYRELARFLVPDLEGTLSGLMGRSAAHLATRGVHTATDFVKDTTLRSVQNLAEFLAHESGDLVSRHEAEHFLSGADELRERLDRLEARLAELERRAEAPGNATGSI